MTEPTTIKPVEERHAGGRPPKWTDPIELAAQIDAYFAECYLEEDTRVFRHGETFPWTDKDGKASVRCKECKRDIHDEYGFPSRGCILVSGRLKERIVPTVTGLCVHLGCHKETLKDYSTRDMFSDPINKAYMLIEQEYEQELHRDKVPPAKTIFGLSNFGWKNPQHIDHTSKGERLPSVSVVSYTPNAPADPASN